MDGSIRAANAELKQAEKLPELEGDAAENWRKKTLGLPQKVEHWSLTTLREKLVKIGAKIVRHGRYVTFQLVEVAIPRSLFADILRLINGLRPAPLPPCQRSIP